jgi:hypothetical protein
MWLIGLLLVLLGVLLMWAGYVLGKAEAEAQARQAKEDDDYNARWEQIRQHNFMKE